MSKLLNSKFKRAFELTKMAAQIGFKELTSGDIQSRVEQAKIITESLSQLRGAAMKAGQLLSLDLEDYFPPEAIKILSQLQNSVKDIPEIDVRKILIQHLPANRYQQITQLTVSSFAAASMGQVYKAYIKIENEEKPIPVVFKVMYPGLENAVESDVDLLQKAMWAFCKMTGRDMDLEPIFNEIKIVLKNEMDYVHEKEAYLKFHELTKSKDWKYLKVKTPIAITDFCTNQFLCLTYEPGLTLKSWMDSKPSTAEREKMALTLLDLYLTEFFEWGYVQTDPNPGNFIVQQDSLVALDFGATKYYDLDFRKRYIKLLKTIRTLDEKAIVDEAISFGLINPKESKEAFAVFVKLLKLGVQPFLNESDFNFSDDAFLKENSQLSKELLSKLKFSPPPHQLIFLHRKLGGIYAILRKLEVKIDVNQFWQRIDQALVSE
jgi:aarF domain-containing kinase